MWPSPQAIAEPAGHGQDQHKKGRLQIVPSPVRVRLVLDATDIGKTQDQRCSHNAEVAPRPLGCPSQKDSAKKQLFQDRRRDGAQEDDEEPLDARRMRRRQTRHGVFFWRPAFPNRGSPNDENVNRKDGRGEEQPTEPADHPTASGVMGRESHLVEARTAECPQEKERPGELERKCQRHRPQFGTDACQFIARL